MILLILSIRDSVIRSFRPLPRILRIPRLTRVPVAPSSTTPPQKKESPELLRGFREKQLINLWFTSGGGRPAAPLRPDRPTQTSKAREWALGSLPFLESDR